MHALSIDSLPPCFPPTRAHSTRSVAELNPSAPPTCAKAKELLHLLEAAGPASVNAYIFNRAPEKNNFPSFRDRIDKIFSLQSLPNIRIADFASLFESTIKIVKPFALP